MEGTIGPAGDPNEPYQAPSAFQDIEVTNLLVPTGTDWVTVPHTIGEFDWPVGKGLILSLSLEVSAPPAVGDQILFEVDTPDIGDTVGGYLMVSSATGLFVQTGAVFGGPPHPELTQWEAHLFTNRVLTAPITVVRARAAFLTI